MGALDNLRFDKNVDQDEAKTLVVYAKEYVKVFHDPFIQKGYERLLVNRFCSKGFCTNVKKRFDNIPPEYVNDVKQFIDHYVGLIFDLLVDASDTFLSEDLREKAISLTDFFKRFGYLTAGQVKLANVIKNKAGGDPGLVLAKHADMAERIVASRIRPELRAQYFEDKEEKVPVVKRTAPAFSSLHAARMKLAKIEQ